MHRLKRDIWKAGIAIAGLLLFLVLVLMLWVPMSASAYEGASELAKAGPAQATPTVDPTMTALQKEQLTQQVRQLDNWWLYWLYNSSTAVIASFATLVVAIFGLYQWRGNRNAERQKETAAQEKELKDRQAAQDKELRDRAEERFKAAVTALGSENEATQVGGAILLRSFLNLEDKEIYGRYYTQIFDLAVAYLRLPSAPQSSEDSNAPLPLTPLRQALIVVFREAFPLARKSLGRIVTPLEARSLDASGIRLDGGFLAMADLKYIWLLNASLRKATLIFANLSEAALLGANLSEANLTGANLSGTSLSQVNLTGAVLADANLSGADLKGANLSKVRRLKSVQSLDHTDLRGVKGLTEDQLKACKAKGAIIDEDATTSSSQPPIAPPTPAQSSDIQAPSAPPAQVDTSPPSTDGSNSISSQGGR